MVCKNILSPLIFYFALSFLVPSGSPSNLSLVEKGSSYALLEWQPPPKESQNGLIRHYIVSLVEGNSSEVRNHTSVSSQPSINIGSLEPGITYTCVVSAVTIGAGPFSDPISFTTESDGRM